MRKGSIHQEDKTILNVYLKMTFKMLEAKTDSSAKRNRQVDTLVEDFNTLLSIIDWTSGQKTSNYLHDLNIIDQLDLTGIYIRFYPTTAEYTSFSSSHRTFTKIDNIQL